jgi:hypothetical protein
VKTTGENMASAATELVTSTFKDIKEHGRHCKSLEVRRRQRYCVSRCVSQADPRDARDARFLRRNGHYYVSN